MTADNDSGRLRSCPACYGPLDDSAHEVVRTSETLRIRCDNGLALTEERGDQKEYRP